MQKTSKQIQGDVFSFLRDSTLSTMISGGVYRQGMRPRDSRKEDAIVIFSTGIPGQIQEGSVVINIYVPDIDPWGNGVFVENGARTEALEWAAQEWVESLTYDRSIYKFRLQQTIYTEDEPSIKQHFIVVKLAFKLVTE